MSIRLDLRGGARLRDEECRANHARKLSGSRNAYSLDEDLRRGVLARRPVPGVLPEDFLRGFIVGKFPAAHEDAICTETTFV